MSTEILMPQLGESVVEGTVSRWLIGEGQPVRQDQPLLQITTDKVDTELTAPASGVLLKILVSEGQTVAKGTVLAVIGDQESGISDQGSGGRDQESGDHAASSNREHPAPVTPSQPTSLPAPNLGFISPAVARLADELDIDLTQVIGTGGGGRITKKDVLAYIAAPVPRGPAGALIGGRSESLEELPPWEQPGTDSLFKPTEEFAIGATGGVPPASDRDVEIVPLSMMRRSIAEHMVLSRQTAPHATTVMEADLTRVVQARERRQGEFERQGVRLTFTPFFVQAIAAGIRAVPAANSSFSEDALLIHRRLHIGVAVALPDGLIVPVIRDAGENSLLELARAVNDLAERARTKRLMPEEVQDGTFTLTNHGTGGSLFATPILVQPQAGILGVGAIRKRPVVVTRGHPLLPDPDDAIAIRPMAYLSFTFDHRVLDGAEADHFLATVKQFLEDYSG